MTPQRDSAGHAAFTFQDLVLLRTAKGLIDAKVPRWDRARVPLIDAMHPGLTARLLAILDSGDESGFYAVPQSLVYANETVAVYRLLNLAADAIEGDDAEFARYLRNRGRDFACRARRHSRDARRVLAAS